MDIATTRVLGGRVLAMHSSLLGDLLTCVCGGCLDRWICTHAPGDDGIIYSICSFVPVGTCCRKISDTMGPKMDRTRRSLTAAQTSSLTKSRWTN